MAEVQAAAKESIVKAAKSSNWADDFSNVRRYWVDAGVVAESDVNTWSEIVKIAQEHILGALPNNFESTDHYNNIKRSWTSKGIAVD